MKATKIALVLVFIVAVGFSVYGTECVIPGLVQDTLKAAFFPEDIVHFDQCVLSGDWPSLYSLADDEILSLRKNPNFDEMLVDFSDITAYKLSSTQVRTIKGWIQQGGHAFIKAYPGSDATRLFALLFGLKYVNRGIGSMLIDYELSEDKKTLALADEVADGVTRLRLSSHGYVMLKDTNEFNMVSVVGGTGREKDHSLIGVIHYGDGFLIYDFPFASYRDPFDMYKSSKVWADQLMLGDFGRLALNLRQWAVDLCN